MISCSDGAGNSSSARLGGDALPMQAVDELESEVVQKLRGEMQEALAEEQARNDALVQRLKCEHQVHTRTHTQTRTHAHTRARARTHKMPHMLSVARAFNMYIIGPVPTG